MTDEKDICRGILDRNPKYLEKLINLCSAPVYALVYRILEGTGSIQDVEECCSDVFSAAWEKIHRYDPTRSGLKSWVLMLAKYRALDFRRTLERKLREIPTDLLEKGPGLDYNAQNPALGDCLHRALMMLPREDREIIYRRYFLYQDIERIAGAAGLTTHAVHNRLWRAREKLRGFMEEISGKEALQ